MKTRIGRGLRNRSRQFVRDVLRHTPIVQMTLLLVVSWALFSAGVYAFERGVEGSTITSYGRALYWGVAAFTTAGIADMPVSAGAELVGGIWIIVGSILFFGAIVATVTGWFMRPLLRPSRQIVDAIEYNLEQLDELSVDELEVLKQTTDTLIENVERVRASRADGERTGKGDSA